MSTGTRSTQPKTRSSARTPTGPTFADSTTRGGVAHRKTSTTGPSRRQPSRLRCLLLRQPRPGLLCSVGGEPLGQSERPSRPWRRPSPHRRHSESISSSRGASTTHSRIADKFKESVPVILNLQSADAGAREAPDRLLERTDVCAQRRHAARRGQGLPPDAEERRGVGRRARPHARARILQPGLNSGRPTGSARCSWPTPSIRRSAS